MTIRAVWRPEEEEEEEDGIEDSNIDSYQRNETIDFMKIPL